MLPDILIWITYGLGTPDHPKALSPTSVRTQIERIATANYGPRGWKCLDRLIYRESRWDLHAKNGTSSARGLFQLLRLPPNLTALEQYARGQRYVTRRYHGSPCMALQHSLRRGWY